MSKFSRLRKNLLSPLSAILAIVSAVLLILAFPDFEFWFLALFALIPLFFAVEREKDSALKSFLTGWLFGVAFFFGSCWWLTFAPITYAHLPAPLVYFFMLGASAIVGIFPGVFAALFSVFLKRFGSWAVLSAPFLWTFTEFLRMWLTGNNWNAIGYSQAFAGNQIIQYASLGGVYLVGFSVVWLNVFGFFLLNLKKFWTRFSVKHPELVKEGPSDKQRGYFVLAFFVLFIVSLITAYQLRPTYSLSKPFSNSSAYLIAVQPNVPMNGLTIEKYQELLKRHIALAENAFNENLPKFIETETKIYSKPETLENDKEVYREFFKKEFQNKPKVIVFPESPMIFQYGRDADLQQFLKDFAVRHNASVLFNSAEVNAQRRILNSAVMIDERGEKIAQYDKIYLVPFGEYIPFPEPLASRMPAFVGNFVPGNEYDLLPFGDARGGVMICFESHFGTLSREYARRGADVLIEMTNDGYLGKTPILRQHLANSVFRAVETNRPLLRVTNVGVTAYINERGEVLDAADVYAEAVRVWTVSKSDGVQTIYVKYGEWFAWSCTGLSLALIVFSLISARRREDAAVQR